MSVSTYLHTSSSSSSCFSIFSSDESFQESDRTTHALSKYCIQLFDYHAVIVSIASVFLSITTTGHRVGHPGAAATGAPSTRWARPIPQRNRRRRGGGQSCDCWLCRCPGRRLDSREEGRGARRHKQHRCLALGCRSGGGGQQQQRGGLCGGGGGSGRRASAPGVVRAGEDRSHIQVRPGCVEAVLCVRGYGRAVCSALPAIGSFFFSTYIYM